jgi:hypothetical protein
MLTENDLDAVSCGVELSLTDTPKANVPDPDGVPLTVPSPERDNPGGKFPEETDHEYGGTPPVAVSVVFGYELFTAPLSRELLVITRGALIVMEKACTADCAGVLLSVTPTMKLKVLAATGVPLITPAVDSISPLGNEPDSTYQE